MDLIRFSIENPVKVTVGVLLIVLFGLVALFSIPVQLVPNVDQPMISIETRWTGRSPEEVEKEVVEEQEDKLKGVSGLRKMTSTVAQGPPMTPSSKGTRRCAPTPRRGRHQARRAVSRRSAPMAETRSSPTLQLRREPRSSGSRHSMHAAKGRGAMRCCA